MLATKSTSQPVLWRAAFTTKPCARQIRVHSSSLQKSEQPDYALIDAQPLNQVVMALFRRKMVDAIGSDVPSKGYDAIIDLTRKLNSMGGPRATQVRTVGILASLFPSWLPGLFKIMFSNPFPDFSCRMNAWATALTCQWLMGKCTVNDAEVDGGKIAHGQGVKVERCRYLEQTGCVAVCVNSCKVPTQEFFATHMGLSLTLTPNYQDYSCQFSFGKTPLPQEQDEAFKSPCFTQCPTGSASAAAASPPAQAVEQLAMVGGRAPSTNAIQSTPEAASSGCQTGNCASQCHRVVPM